MRTLTWLVILAGVLIAPARGLRAADDAGAEAAKKELARLEGTWKGISEEVEGQKTPDDTVRENARMLLFKDGKLTVQMRGETRGVATLTLDVSKTPKTMDIEVVEGQGLGAKSLAIYEIDGDLLKLCGNILGTPPARPTEFATMPQSDRILIVCERVKQ